MNNQAHDCLEPKYLGKIVCYDDNGVGIYGMVNNIVVESSFGYPTVIIHIGNGRYECDYEYLEDNIKVLE